MGGDGAVPERLSMFTRGRLIATASALGALLVAGASVGVPAAGASASSVASSPVTGVLSVSAAKALGYPQALLKPVGSSKTGQAGCTKGAQAKYEDRTGKWGVGVVILVCDSTKVAAKLLATQKKAAAATLQKAPTQLGPTAFETASNQSEYLLYWQRGRLLSVVALDVNIPASSSSSTTTTPPPPPPTAAQQKTLTGVALVQDKALK